MKMSEKYTKTGCEEELTIGLKIIQKDIEYIKARTEEINKKLEKDYVTRTEFEPIKNGFYGFVALALTILISSLIYLVVNK
jgi:hypothetical protein